VQVGKEAVVEVGFETVVGKQSHLLPNVRLTRASIRGNAPLTGGESNFGYSSRHAAGIGTNHSD
jgi:hypothetical protein